MRTFLGLSRSTIEKAKVTLFPFPYFIVDDILTKKMLGDVVRNWPDSALFEETGIRGNSMFFFNNKINELTKTQKYFWRDFMQETLLTLYRQTFSKFSATYAYKFGNLLQKINFHVRLMEMAPTYVDHEIHTHHWHDPTWLFTSLIYVDDDGLNLPGTSLYGSEDNLVSREMAEIAAQTLQWEDMTDKITSKIDVEFKKNRMLSFLDCPISYHGVKPIIEHRDASTRKVIRCHAYAPISLTRELYGIRHDEYQFHRRRASKKEFVINFLEKEINSLKQSLNVYDDFDGKSYCKNIISEIDCQIQT